MVMMQYAFVMKYTETLAIGDVTFNIHRRYIAKWSQISTWQQHRSMLRSMLLQLYIIIIARLNMKGTCMCLIW